MVTGETKTITKVCFRCEKEYPLSDFYVHKQMADGHLNKCKFCTMSDSYKREKRIRSTNEGVLAERKRHREKYQRLGYCEKQKEWDSLKYWKNTTEYKSQSKRARSIGVLELGDEIHHWNYHFINDVFIIDRSTHKRIHRLIELDIEKRIYKFGDIYLDTKEKHEKFIVDFINKESENRRYNFKSINL